MTSAFQAPDVPTNHPRNIYPLFVARFLGLAVELQLTLAMPAHDFRAAFSGQVAKRALERRRTLQSSTIE